MKNELLYKETINSDNFQSIIKVNSYTVKDYNKLNL